MTWSKHTLFIFATLAIVGGSINMLIHHSPFIGILASIVYILSLSVWIGYTLPSHIQQGRTLLGVIILLSTIILLNVAIYYPYKITLLTSIFVWFITLFFFALPQRVRVLSQFTYDSFLERSHVLATILCIVSEIYLFKTVFSARTTDVLPSPWMTFDAQFFILYAITTIIILYLLTHKSGKTPIVLSIIHFFLLSAIAPIVYTLGYGFDGIIHRVTEQWIATNGFIAPKNPFYIGQYGLVVWLHHILHISVRTIDIYLVPILASLFIPLTTALTLEHAYTLPKKISRALVFFFPFIFFIAFHLTTPHNFALLFTIITIGLLTLSLHKKVPLFIPILSAIITLSIHPLIGAPLITSVISIAIISRIRHRLLSYSMMFMSCMVIALTPAILFTIYLLIHHYSLPQLTNPLSHVSQFIDIFRRPFWYQKNAPLIFQMLYTWQSMIGGMVVGLGIYGFIKDTKKTREAIMFPLTMLAWFVAAWLLRTWIVFPDVHALEQNGYPLRLITTSILFIVPWAIYGVYAISSQLIVRLPRISPRIWHISFLMGSGILLMISLYFTYPQYNQKVHFGGYNITQYDHEAVAWIHAQHPTDYDYIVLSNSITSVTALERYNFVKYFDTPQGELFYYAIPTGGPLYSYYAKMLYEGQKREYMIDAMDLTQVNTAYFVVNWYWGNFDTIIQGAKQTAQSWHIIYDTNDNEKIYIFEYIK